MTIGAGDELRRLRRIGRIVHEALSEMQRRAAVGMTTAELDAIGLKILRRHRAQPTPQRVYGFPGGACISLNEEVVHGVPGPRVIAPGDVVKIDLTADLGGYVADATRIVLIPPVTPVAERLAACAQEALEQALRVARAGNRVRHIGQAVQRVVQEYGFAVVRELAGHGVGRDIHEPPAVPNFDDPAASQELHEGMVITIEPILSAGSPQIIKGRDGWTIRTRDRSLAAHFEQTIMITRAEPVVVTAA